MKKSQSREVVEQARQLKGEAEPEHVSDNYERITRLQGKRDLEAIARIEKEYVAPLRKDLEENISGYGEMSNPERFIAIMDTNQKEAGGPCGYSLPLDFGEGWGDNIIGVGCVFSGPDDKKVYESLTTGGPNSEVGECPWVTTYIEKFPWVRTELFETPYVRALNKLPPQWLDECLEKYREDYDALPATFKIGIVAQLVSQCVLVPYSEACRFAAGWTDTIRPRRILWSPFQSKRFGPRGWLLAIRDLMPKNELMRYCAGKLRASSPVAHDLEIRSFFPHFFPHLEDVYEIQHREEHELQNEQRVIRSRQERTETLVYFIDVDLPSQGYHVGRKDLGKSISWDDARERFNSEYPEYEYKTTRSFSNSYRQAKKRE